MHGSNKVIYDWFSMTSKIHTVSEMIDELGMQNAPWLTLQGVRGYSWREHCNSINVHHGKRPEIWLEMSGSGCRAFEDLGCGDYEALFELVRNDPQDIKLTRLDIAFDDFDYILDIHQLFYDTFVRRDFICKCEWVYPMPSINTRDPNLDGMTLVFGRESSDTLIRIYDKRAESLGKLQTKKEKEEFAANVPHWVRVEIQLRHERANEWAHEIKERGMQIGEMFAGVLRNYLRFVERPLGSSDENRWRWPMKDYWNELIGQAEAIQLYEKPGMEYNLQRLDRLTTYQIGNAVDTAIQIHGVDGFLDKLARNKPPKVNPKYAQLLKQHGTPADRAAYERSVYETDNLRAERQASIDDPKGAWQWADGDEDLTVDEGKLRAEQRIRADMEEGYREAVRKNELRERAYQKRRQAQKKKDLH